MSLGAVHYRLFPSATPHVCPRFGEAPRIAQPIRGSWLFRIFPPLLPKRLLRAAIAIPRPSRAPLSNPKPWAVSAQTGSGKTVAFGMAMARELLTDDGRLPFADAPLALVIAPTRELALQVSRELEWLYAGVNARMVTCVGGMDPVKERRQLQHGAQQFRHRAGQPLGQELEVRVGHFDSAEARPPLEDCQSRVETRQGQRHA